MCLLPELKAQLEDAGVTNRCKLTLEAIPLRTSAHVGRDRFFGGQVGLGGMLHPRFNQDESNWFLHVSSDVETCGFHAWC